MFKVLCIDATDLPAEFQEAFELKENEVYEVLEVDTQDDMEYYLIHRTLYFKFYYQAKRFIPLSNKDEMAMEKKKQSVLQKLFALI